MRRIQWFGVDGDGCDGGALRSFSGLLRSKMVDEVTNWKKIVEDETAGSVEGRKRVRGKPMCSWAGSAADTTAMSAWTSFWLDCQMFDLTKIYSYEAKEN